MLGSCSLKIVYHQLFVLVYPQNYLFSVGSGKTVLNLHVKPAQGKQMGINLALVLIKIFKKGKMMVPLDLSTMV